MYWKVACSRSPMKVALKQLPYGLLLREENGTATYYTYYKFPQRNRPATEDELQEETGWLPLLHPLTPVNKVKE